MPKTCQRECEHEDQAITIETSTLMTAVKSTIPSMLSTVGLFCILHTHSFGVSPNEIINCSYCSTGMLEIKFHMNECSGGLQSTGGTGQVLPSWKPPIT